MSQDEADAEFKRQGSNVEKLDDYVDTLRGMEIGQALTVKVSEETVNDKYVEIVPDTEDTDGKADTVRMFKRRMNAAADSLNFTLKWKAKGHRTGEGEDARFVTDWLVARADNSKPEASNGDGKVEAATETAK